MNPPTCGFRLACWVFGVIAFAQLLAAGVALAVRVENAREVQIEERIVTRIVTVPAAAPSPPAAPPVVALPPPPVYIADAPVPPARPLDAPPIQDPVVERLVTEAREARVAEDVGTAITKLDSALERAPEDPNVLYERGLLFESMAAHDTRLADRAAEAYQAVYNLGTTGAGALYPLAAEKLREGIARPADMRGKLSLGRPRIFQDDAYQNGERVVVTIPVHAAPGSEPSADDFLVTVKFFDTIPNGEPQPASEDCETQFEWVSGAIDWLGGEEVLRVTYILPPQDQQQQHLFGRRSYYGLIAELVYKNELIDSYPWPRHLASLSSVKPQQQDMDPLFLDQERLVDDGLLPPLADELSVPGFSDAPDP